MSECDNPYLALENSSVMEGFRSGALVRPSVRSSYLWRQPGQLLAWIVSAGDSRMTPIPADTSGRIELDELRKRAGRYFDRITAGQTIEVIRGGKLVARVVSGAGNEPRSTA